MISALCWVPKGAAKAEPILADPPSKEEIEEILKEGGLETREESDGEEDADLDVDSNGKLDEVSHALAAADALGNTSSKKFQDITDALKDLDMDHYDDEDGGIEIFTPGVGDVYYPSNDMDPYLKDKEDEVEEEVEDMTIKPTDGVIICARNEDGIGQLEVCILEESEDGELNMYVHHDIILPAYPLCLAWLDCHLKGEDKGNFMAVGSMDPAIEIWDLDLIDELQPLMALGGTAETKDKKKKKKKKVKKAAVKFKEGSHSDAVLGLAWNKEVRNVLASASADKSVKVWDVTNGKCAVTVERHMKEVQSVAWNKYVPEVLLSGSFDHSVVMMDMRSSSHEGIRWSVPADVECLVWDPHAEHAFAVSLEDGTVLSFDVRAASLSPCFTLHAHDKAVSTISYNPSTPNLLATASTDKTVKLWDLSNNQPSCVVSKSPKVGAVFSISFSEDNPFLLAIGGSTGKLDVWNTMLEDGVARRYGTISNRR